ncbi:hypothetical protein [Streptomyces sp. SAI-041]|uniref:hypothetical protein n=1 Tax=Streptomyces sp. SAI-041 TaxID=2940548 RepID=UPI00247416D4|nr:hypothetical protein [Streptomyces sp. SAI-041]MDH6548601.1 hypothetical protein [Streptomyces sp. SAI-041]
MTTPAWWAELTGVSEVLAEADRAGIQEWRGPAAQDGDDDVPPLTVRLGTLGRVFAECSAGFTPEQTRELFRLLEEIQAADDERYANAVATGFFEALLNAWDKGFDLRSVWPALGPRSRAYCRAWNGFTGVPTPDWMR